jgi:hypothetical protein
MYSVGSLSRQRRLPWLAAWPVCILLAASSLAGCQKLHRTDMTPLVQAGMYFNNVEQLRQLGVSDGEVAQLVAMRQAGVTDETCIELFRIAHMRQQLFTDGQAVAGLRGAGLAENSALELARLNQLGLWSGEAQALRLSGLSDQVILAIARRRAAAQPVLSAAKVAELKNASLSEAQILADINSGISDEQADRIIAERDYAAGGHSFVRQRRRR